jgi:hypothetical protein
MRTTILSALFSLSLATACGTGDPTQEGTVEENFGAGKCEVNIDTGMENGQCWVNAGNKGLGGVCKLPATGTLTQVKWSIPAVWVDTHTCLVNGN